MRGRRILKVEFLLSKRRPAFEQSAFFVPAERRGSPFYKTGRILENQIASLPWPVGRPRASRNLHGFFSLLFQRGIKYLRQQFHSRLLHILGDTRNIVPPFLPLFVPALCIPIRTNPCVPGGLSFRFRTFRERTVVKNRRDCLSGGMFI